MGRRVNSQCKACAAEDVESARRKSCWAGKLCHDRRSYYRRRDRLNAERRIARRRGKIPTFKVDVTQQPYAIAYVERATATADSPILAIYIEIKQGSKAIAEIAKVDAHDWRSAKVRTYLEQCLQLLKEKFGITRFAEVIESAKTK